jgi:hypothetical protein
VFVIIVGMAILYLVVTHGSDTGNAVERFGGFLVNLTSSQPLFVKAGGTGTTPSAPSDTGTGINLPDLTHIFGPTGGPPAFSQPPAPSQVLPGQAGINQAFAETFLANQQIHPDWGNLKLVTETWAQLKKAGYPIPTGADNPNAYNVGGPFNSFFDYIRNLLAKQNAVAAKGAR